MPTATVTPIPARVRCPACASLRTATITMTLTDGSDVQFTSCRACEHKTWVGADGPMELQRVLDRAQRRRA